MVVLVLMKILIIEESVYYCLKNEGISEMKKDTGNKIPVIKGWKGN